MTEVLLGTREGLITLRQGVNRWSVADVAFVGLPVECAFFDERTDARWAALQHGHWGPKRHRSDDGGATWMALPMPGYSRRRALR